MADNVQITAGSGTTIRAIDFGGGILGQVLVLGDSSGNLVATTVGNNGRGANVVILNDVPVIGMDASGAVMQSANNPVYVGGRVRLGTSQLVLEADADAIGATMTGDGKFVTYPLGCPEDQGPTTPIVAANDTNAHTLIAAQASTPAPGVRIALWGLECVNTTATPTSVIIFDGATEVFRFAVPVNPGRPTSTLPAPIKSSAAVAMNYQLTANVGANALFLCPLWYRARA